jgi:ElaB/YqjD/DUF883 family membrane-anchored ribosome-binding protein
MSTRASNVEDLNPDITSEKLRADLRAVMIDAEELLRTGAVQAGEKASETAGAARAKVQESLRLAKERLMTAETALADRTREAARATDLYVHENPWKSIGVAASLGVIVGMLIARR